MKEHPRFGFLPEDGGAYAIVLGTNEIASAIALRLRWERFRVVMSHDPDPPVIRRGMAFHDALFDDQAAVDGSIGQRADTMLEMVDIFTDPGKVAVTAQQLTDLITYRTPAIIVDARMQKHRETPDLRGVARLAIGVGPRFVVNHNCDVAVETHPARTGELIHKGETRPADGVARLLGGLGKERFVYSARPGIWRTPLDIGAMVFRGLVIGYYDRIPVRAPMDGYLRGIARDGVHAQRGAKLVEIDPRGRAANWTGTDERGRQIAEAVIAAVKERSPRAASRALSHLN